MADNCWICGAPNGEDDISYYARFEEGKLALEGHGSHEEICRQCARIVRRLHLNKGRPLSPRPVSTDYGLILLEAGLAQKGRK
jgi:hypothetical protein